MIIERNDVIDYLRYRDAAEVADIVSDAMRTYVETAEIAEALADTCQYYLTRYALIDKEE